MGNKDNTLDSIDLGKFLSALWHWAWLVILAGVVAGVIAFLVSGIITPIYEANTTVLVNEAPSNKAIDYSSLQLSSQLSQTYSQMIVKTPILIKVANNLGIPQIDPLSVTAKAVTSTQLIYITAESEDPVMASKIANEIVTVFSEDLQTIQADRFSASKLSLQSRITDVEKQILETSQQIALYDNSDDKVLLNAKLDLLKQTHSSLLQSYEQILLNETITDFRLDTNSLRAKQFADTKLELENQIEEIEKQILETSTLISQDANQEEKIQLEAKLVFYQQTYTSLLQSYEQIRLSEDQTVSTIVQVEPALPPVEPLRPKKLLYTALAVLVSMIMAVCVIYIIDIRDDTLKTPDDVVDVLGLPVLGIISHFENNTKGPITESMPRLPVSEAFRNLRTNLMHATTDQGLPLRSILITSIMAGEGKSTIVTNLGVVFAQNNKNVSLLDADLRRSKLHQLLGLKNEFGLSDVFSLDESKILANGLLQATKTKNLSVVTAGKLPPNPSELLGSEKMNSILKVLNYCSEVILIDTPPVLAVTDASVLAPYVDGVLLVMKPGVTKLKLAHQVVNQFKRMDVNILGVVINDINPKLMNSGDYYDNHYNVDKKVMKNIVAG